MKISRTIGKIIIATALATTAHTMAVGQTHYRSNISLGVKGGVDVSRVFFNPGVRQTFAVGGTTGVTFRYIEEDHFGIIAELNYSQRGWKENFEEAPYNYTRTLNYVQLPILAHIYFGRRGKFFINAGPEFGVFAGESTKSNFDPAKINSLPGFPVTNRMNTQLGLDVQNKFDYGITAGIGGEFNITPKHSISVEGRFYYGLGNIFKSKRTDPFSASNQMSIAATVNYWFRIK